jgi:hypothetical protein
MAFMVSFNHCQSLHSHGFQFPWTSSETLHPSSSYDSILVVVGYLTKMVHFIMCTKIITNKRTTKLLPDHVFLYHGLLKDISFDHGLQFASKFWKWLFKLLGVKVKLSLVFHPQMDGQT